MEKAYSRILGGEKVIVTILKCKIMISSVYKRHFFSFVITL